MTTPVRSAVMAALIGSSTLASGVFAQDVTPPRGATSLGAALRGTKPIVDARVRAEAVDQDPLLDDAEAATLRLRAGFETGKAWGTSLLAEGEFVTPISTDYRPDNARATQVQFPIVADPESYEVNRLQLTNSALPGTTLTLGRQRIVLDDHRFVGNVGWRQNEQTYDAARAVNKSVKNLTVDVAYLNQVNRVFGPESPQGRYEGDGVLANVAYRLPVGKLTALGYVLDFDPLTRFPGLTAAQAAALNPIRVSTETYGLRFAGERNLQSLLLGYTASYATQADYGSNPFQFDLDYYTAEFTGGYRQYGIVLGAEILEGDGVVGFATPLATLHRFNGWADKFLTTPANGLDDRYAGVSYAAKALGIFDTLSAAVVYHEFQTQRLDVDLGTETDVQLQAKMKRFTGVVKYALFEAHEGRTPVQYQDTSKFWLQVEYVW